MRSLVLVLPFAACVAPREVPVRQVARAPTSPAEPARPPVSEWRELGRSVQGRPIRAREVGSGARRVLWVGGIHGNEREGTLATAALPADFLAAGLGDRVTLTIVEDLNPDGRAVSTRGNANGVDLNRNFPARTFVPASGSGERPLSEPESRILHDLIRALRPDLVIVCHSWSNRHFINYDGPAGDLARRFAALSGYPLVESRSFAATPGSLGSFVGGDLGLPILTIEWRQGCDWQAAWEDVRRAALAVIEGS
ncbi:MAG TPA: M14 family zinc carboxypeptidase [Planctomycetota bacterium]|nr:M14 family zinc carboxypeptidase [Planctomycetota bacterium]